MIARLIIASALALGSAACTRQQSEPQPAVAQHIDWREGDVDDALAEAKEAGKPVLLYWGAKWCPPCNQMKSTLFKDPAFIARTRSFVPVYLDGDTPGAQRWGERFGISGYPTVIVLRADGAEVTRLSSSATASRLADILKLASSRRVSTEDLLRRAETDSRSLSADDWSLLAAYDWQNDPRHFKDPQRAATLLNTLSRAAPTPAQQRRFALLALTMGAKPDSEGKYTLTADEVRQVEQLVPAMLAHPEEITAARQELSYSLPPLIAAVPDAAARANLSRSLVAALDRVYGDETLPIPDRLGTLVADIALGKGADGKVAPAVLAKVRQRVAWADGVAKDTMVRQSVISNAAELLDDAGDRPGARRLLTGELKRSASPYYYMLELATLAEEDKDPAGAIAWARKGYESAQGSATRVQWAIAYSSTVLRLKPRDTAAVEASADAVIAELGKNPDGYYQRTRVKVAKWGQDLQAWSKSTGNAAVLTRVNAKMDAVCSQQGAVAATCRAWTRAA